MNSLESLVRRLGEEAGDTSLALDAEAGCTLMFDEQTVLEIRPNASGERVILSATVCDYRPDHELAVLRELAAANFDALGTGGAVLAANTRERLEPARCRGVLAQAPRLPRRRAEPAGGPSSAHCPARLIRR